MARRRSGMRVNSSSSPQRIRVATPRDIARIRQSEKTNGSLKGLKSAPGLQRTAFSDTMLALPKERQPFDSFMAKGIPFEIDEPDEREKIRSWARGFFKTHSLVAICVDIYSRFPVQGVEFQSKDKELTEFYDTLFLDQLNYEEFLVEMGREYWTVGECNTLGSWNEVLGVWDAEEILDPDDITATFSPFDKDYICKLKVPAHIKEIISTQEPRWEYERLMEDYPEIVHAASEDDATLDVSPTLLSRMINKTSPWDVYGTPHMMRCFRELLSEESLNAAQDAVADRLYSPFILAKLGIQDIGDGEPWIPQQGDIDAVRDNLQSAMAADFRLLVHHFGIEIESVFGREAMPRLGDDYDRVERKILQTWGIGESLISGSTQGTYASSALNQELVSQLMTTIQKQFKKHFRKRAEVVAEAQGHFDFEEQNSKRIPVYEEVLFVDPDTGEEFIEKKPRLLIPDIHFATLNLRDEDTERQFLLTLRQSGVPLSDEAMMVNIPYDFEEELEKVQKETIEKTIMQQETNQKLIVALQKRGLPLTPELQQLAIQQAQYDQMMAGPPETQDGQGGPEGGGGGEEGQAGAQDQGGEEEGPPVDTSDEGTEEEVSSHAGHPSGQPQTKEKKNFQPRNQLRARPEISDNQRRSSRTARMYMEDPRSKGQARKLTEESVQDLVENRPWTKALDPERV